MRFRAWMLIATLFVSPAIAAAYTSEELIQLLTADTIPQTASPESESAINALQRALGIKPDTPALATTTASTTSASSPEPSTEAKRQTALEKLNALLKVLMTEWGKLQIASASSTPQALVGAEELLPEGCPRIDRVLKRGSIEAMGERGQARVITAKVPLAEMFGFTTQLRSLTEGRGVPNLEFSHYAVVPRNVQDEIITSRK